MASKKRKTEKTEEMLPSEIRMVMHAGFEQRLLVEWDWRYLAPLAHALHETCGECILFCDPVAIDFKQMDDGHVCILEGVLTAEVLNRYVIRKTEAAVVVFRFLSVELKRFLSGARAPSLSQQKTCANPVTLQVAGQDDKLRAWIYAGTPERYTACQELSCGEGVPATYEQMHMPPVNPVHATVQSTDWIRALESYRPKDTPEIRLDFDPDKKLARFDDGAVRREFKFRSAPGATLLNQKYSTRYILSMHRLFRSVPDLEIGFSIALHREGGCLTLRIGYDIPDAFALLLRHTPLFERICRLVMLHLQSAQVARSYVAFWLAPKIAE